MPSTIHIDAHQHFWHIARGDYDWMDDSVAAIRHDIMPNDLKPHLEAHEINGTVVVQAAATVAETRFILQLADNTDFIKGAVGWVDLENAEAANTLDRLIVSPYFKGIRPMLQDIADTNWILQPAIIANLKEVAKRGLRLDALITPRHLEVILQLSEKLPQLQIVIDHCAKPDFTKDKDAQIMWCGGMTKLAKQPNVMCKISGLANEAGPDWNSDKLKPYIDHVIEAFGTSRLMWGSDWPVLNLVGDYARWQEVSAELLKDLSDQERAAIYGSNAIKFYDLKI